MCKNPNARLLIRLIIDIAILIVIYVIALLGLPYWQREQVATATAELSSSATNSTANYRHTALFTPVRRGFFCSDDSLRYPYNHNVLLNQVHLLVLIIALPTAVILIVEMLRTAFRPTAPVTEAYNFVGLRVPTLLSECYQLMGAYLFGLGLLSITTTLTKLYTGRLRPYFHDVCQPQLNDGSSCDDVENLGIYIEDYTCSELATVSTELFATLRQSFPSAYAARVAYALAFIAVYLQARMRATWLHLLRTVLQFAGATILAFVAMERINSLRHHWTDVVAGVLLGIIFASFISFGVLKLITNEKSAVKRYESRVCVSKVYQRKYPKYF